MSDRDGSSPTLFVVLVVGVLAVTGYLAWRVYQTPRHPDEAGEIATKMTDVTVVAGGGDASVCQQLRNFTSEDALDEALARCAVVAGRAAAANGAGWLGIRDLRVTDTQLDRSSGSVTVSGTLITPGPPLPTTFRWPVTFVDGHWYIDGGADVEVG